MADTQHFVDDIASHVRGLLNDAERRATDILGQAEASANALREAAEAEAARIRHQAEADAAAIREPAELTAERAESGARRLLAEFRHALEQLEATLGWDKVDHASSQPAGVPETPGTVPGQLASEPEPPATPAEEPAATAAEGAAAAFPTAGGLAPQGLTEQTSGPGEPSDLAEEARSAPERPAAEMPARTEVSEDAEAARLVAMKLALEGSTPEEIKAKLAADYLIDDLDALIDQVYTQSAHLSRIKKWMPSLKRAP